MQTISGIITLVQEQRFQLIDDAGRPHLFVLDHGAKLDGEDLYPFQHDHRRVTVHFESCPKLIAALAHDVTFTDSPAPAAAGGH